MISRDCRMITHEGYDNSGTVYYYDEGGVMNPGGCMINHKWGMINHEGRMINHDGGMIRTGLQVVILIICSCASSFYLQCHITNHMKSFGRAIVQPPSRFNMLLFGFTHVNFSHLWFIMFVVFCYHVSYSFVVSMLVSCCVSYVHVIASSNACLR